MTLDHQFYFRNGFWRSESYGKVVLHYILGILVQKSHFPVFDMLIICVWHRAWVNLYNIDHAI